MASRHWYMLCLHVLVVHVLAALASSVDTQLGMFAVMDSAGQLQSAQSLNGYTFSCLQLLKLLALLLT
jgi:hypothetical protein